MAKLLASLLTPDDSRPSVRRRALLARYVLVANLLGVFAAWATWPEPGRRAMTALGLVIASTSAAYVLSVRCPRCRTPVFKRETIGRTFRSFFGFLTIPRTCSRCGSGLP